MLWVINIQKSLGLILYLDMNVFEPRLIIIYFHYLINFPMISPTAENDFVAPEYLVKHSTEHVIIL